MPLEEVKIDNARLQGIACALAEVAEFHADVAKNALESMGLSLSDLKRAGADKYDLDRLRKIK